MRRCNFCKFKCNRISKMAAHFKDKHPDEFKALSHDRVIGIKAASEVAAKKSRRSTSGSKD